MDGSKGLDVVEGEHFDVIGAGGFAPPVLASKAATGAPQCAVVSVDHQDADGERWIQRALRAEGKLDELARMLDEYRDKNRPMPTYSDLIRVLGS